MKEIKLTQGQITLVDDNDFKLLSLFKWCVIKKNNKYGTTYYAVRAEKKNGKYKMIYMHSYIMGIDTSYKIHIDHIDGNPLNNQRNNLRYATPTQNHANTKITGNGLSKYKGVTFRKCRKLWVAQIRVNNNLKNIGLFKYENEAAFAYNQEAIKYFGEFARINIIL